jgi:anaerobic selenocysteine-containing dehydrogenase
LQAAAPHVWAELSPTDAADLGVADGDLVDVISPRGAIRAEARIARLPSGTVFVPFHYGYWDTTGDRPASGEPGTAANEATITDYDPVSKQPLFKTSAARIARAEGATR